MKCKGCGQEVESLGGVDFICWHCAGQGQVSDETAEAICKVFLGISREELAGALRTPSAMDGDEAKEEPDPQQDAEPERKGRGWLGSSLRSWLTGIERREQVQ